MEILFYFLLGVIFIQYLMPLCDSLLSLILTYIETLKGKLSIKIAQYNEELHKEKDETFVVQGFVAEKDDIHD